MTTSPTSQSPAQSQAAKAPKSVAPRSRRGVRAAWLVTAILSMLLGGGAGLALRLMLVEESNPPRATAENRFNLQLGSEQSFPPSDDWPDDGAIDTEQPLYFEEGTVLRSEMNEAYGSSGNFGRVVPAPAPELTDRAAEASAFPEPVLPETATRSREKPPAASNWASDDRGTDWAAEAENNNPGAIAPESNPSAIPSPSESLPTESPKLEPFGEVAPSTEAPLAPIEPEFTPLPLEPAPVAPAPEPPLVNSLDPDKPSADKASTPTGTP